MLKVAVYVNFYPVLCVQLKYDNATVACDGEMFPVHRVVLAACSEYFSEMFEVATPTGRHPVIVIKDVSCEIFQAILRFMYVGEVDIQRNKLSALMNAARYLKITCLQNHASGQDVSSIRPSIDSQLDEPGTSSGGQKRKISDVEPDALGSTCEAVDDAGMSDHEDDTMSDCRPPSSSSGTKEVDVNLPALQEAENPSKVWHPFLDLLAFL